MQRISTIFTDRMSTYHVLREAHSRMASEFSPVYHDVSKGLSMNRHNKVAWEIYLNAHSICSIYEFFSAFGKLRKTTVCLAISVCLSVLPHGTLGSHRTYLSENLYLRIFRKIHQEYSSCISLTRITATLHEDQFTFAIITTKIFKQIHLHAVLVQEISTIFIDQTPAVQVSEQCLLCWCNVLGWGKGARSSKSHSNRRT
jgi:hypothetical protein